MDSLIIYAWTYYNALIFFMTETVAHRLNFSTFFNNNHKTIKLRSLTKYYGIKCLNVEQQTKNFHTTNEL